MGGFGAEKRQIIKLLSYLILAFIMMDSNEEGGKGTQIGGY